MSNTGKLVPVAGEGGVWGKPAGEGVDPILETKLVEKTVLLTHRRTQHLSDSLLKPSALRNHAQPSPSKDFFNKLSQKMVYRGGCV